MTTQTAQRRIENITLAIKENKKMLDAAKIEGNEKHILNISQYIRCMKIDLKKAREVVQ
jgi:hypothetical protein